MEVAGQFRKGTSYHSSLFYSLLPHQANVVSTERISHEALKSLGSHEVPKYNNRYAVGLLKAHHYPLYCLYQAPHANQSTKSTHLTLEIPSYNDALVPPSLVLHYLPNTPPYSQGSICAGPGRHRKHSLGVSQMPDLHSWAFSLRIICISCVPVAVVCSGI